MAKTGSFQLNKFDPILVSSQICAFQSFLYVTLSLILILGLTFLNINLSLSAIFDFRQINVSNSEGVLIISCFIINSLFGALFLWTFVKRRKLCLDFCCTYHFIHFIICCCFEGEFPSLSYWLLNVTCLVIMTVTSEYLCLKEEMKEIPLYQSLSTKADL
ncbi:CLUMA_CG019064, isoform A [Clunio marinus]|uniref:CLUMA_CG019064, isoform A n=1 Tax=Clunio marinus TaxID=568069 RepID=A0A1J1J1S9_9DIPT|nr:CLUMA_CG019064, isoform A [Clunio marinus]